MSKHKGPKGPSKSGTSADEPPSYQVGKGRPSKDHQYKPGQSGNPLGRPKGSKNAATLAREILNGMVKMRNADGTVQNVTRRMGMLLQCAQKGLKGDIKAAAFLFQTEAGPGSEAADSTATPEEQIIIDAYLQTYLRNKSKDRA
jgi:hypothetical protein